jgi:hypothetical protein
MTSVYVGPPLKPQPQHSAADLARARVCAPGDCALDPLSPYYVGFNRAYGAAPRAVLPDPPGGQRRAPKSEPAPGSRGGNLLRWLRRQRQPVRQAAITAQHGREPGSTLVALVRDGHVQRRAVKFPTIATPVFEYWAGGREWPAVAAGAVVVECAERSDA